MEFTSNGPVVDICVFVGLAIIGFSAAFLPKLFRARKALRMGYEAAAKVYNPSGQEVYALDIKPNITLPPGILWEQGYKGYLEEHGLPVTDEDERRIRHNPYMYRDDSLRFEQE